METPLWGASQSASASVWGWGMGASESVLGGLFPDGRGGWGRCCWLNGRTAVKTGQCQHHGRKDEIASVTWFVVLLPDTSRLNKLVLSDREACGPSSDSNRPGDLV